MAYQHGVYYSEVPTSLLPPVTVSAPTVVFGTAPLHLAANPAEVNKPILCSSYAEFVERFGWSNDFDSYTLCEAAYVFFALCNIAPIICVNVLDLASDNKSGSKELTGLSNAVTIENVPIILSTVEATSGTTALVKDTDYTVAHDSDGNVVFTVLNQSKITGDKATLSYKEVDVTKVTASDIVGGVDVTTGKKTGLELIEEVYPRLGLIPGTIIAPKFSTESAVAAVMKAKCLNINGCFQTICAVDIDTSTVKKYSDCNEYKNNNNLTDKNMLVCYPKVSLGGVQYFLSTQAAAVMCLTDNQNGDIPYVSPSNHNLQCDRTCLADGTDVYLSKLEANYLNGIGIVTGLNFSGGWKLWSNRTGAYPSNADPKDNFIPMRRMINWVGNTIVTTYFSKTDAPINKRLIETITDSVQIWLNGLAAQGVILGGRITFDADVNPVTSLIDGIIRFHIYLGLATPARAINFDLEFDPSYFATLFE